MYEKSIELLNRAVADEIAAVHQYMYFHFHCNDQGYDLLSGLFRTTSMQEMLHAELLAERILFLKGEVELVASGPVQQVHDVQQMLEIAKKSEETAVRNYNLWANECAANADSVSKKLFETLVGEEEVHYDRFYTELENISKFGAQYLALQSIERSKTIAAGPTTAA